MIKLEKGMLKLHELIPLRTMVLSVILFVSGLVWFSTGFIGLGSACHRDSHGANAAKNWYPPFTRYGDYSCSNHDLHLASSSMVSALFENKILASA